MNKREVARLIKNNIEMYEKIGNGYTLRVLDEQNDEEDNTAYLSTTAYEWFFRAEVLKELLAEIEK